MLTGQYIINEIKAIKPELVKKYSVTRLGLFGSYANGNPDDNSDIDILIDFEKPAGWDFFKIEKILEELFNRKVDLVTPASIKEHLKTGILNDLIEI